MTQAIRVETDTLSFVVHDASFRKVLGTNPRLELVVETDAHEGPVYAADEDALYFTSLPVGNPPQVSIKRVALDSDRFPLERERVSAVRASANAANGMTLSADGGLLVCEQGGPDTRARISRVDRRTGDARTVVDEWRDLPFNSPNDVVERSDGSVWFTDPSYGYLQGFRPEPAVGDYVYRYDPSAGRTTVVADSFNKPNGIALSPNESVLYVTDSGANQTPGSYHPQLPHRVMAFDIAGGRRLANARLFAVISPGFPDGIKCDADGRVYVSAFNGVHVFDPDGDLLGEIVVDGAVNFTFGGPDNNVLFITTDDAIWAAVLEVCGPTRKKGAS